MTTRAFDAARPGRPDEIPPAFPPPRPDVPPAPTEPGRSVPEEHPGDRPDERPAPSPPETPQKPHERLAIRVTGPVGRSMLVLLLWAGLSGCVVYESDYPVDRRSVHVSVDVFEAELAGHGEWLIVEDYGRVWSPYHVPVGWRPYTHGRWVWTRWGWTWSSSWPWGWCGFHYGRWWRAPAHGWVWVPGRVWGPAWVAWRHGPGWVGWAPLPPGAIWHPRHGLSPRAWRNLNSSWWCFVPHKHLLAHKLHHHVVPAYRGGGLLAQTRDVTRYERRGPRIFNRGVDVRGTERITGRPIERRELVNVDRRVDLRGARQPRDPLPVYRPKALRRQPVARPRADRRQPASRPTVDRRTPVSRPRVDRRQPRPPTSRPPPSVRTPVRPRVRTDARSILERHHQQLRAARDRQAAQRRALPRGQRPQPTRRPTNRRPATVPRPSIRNQILPRTRPAATKRKGASDVRKRT